MLAEYQKNAEKAEVERIEVAKTVFKKRKDMDMSFCKVTAKVQREAKVKARKEVAAVKRSESEKVEGSRKWG